MTKSIEAQNKDLDEILESYEKAEKIRTEEEIEELVGFADYNRMNKLLGYFKK